MSGFLRITGVILRDVSKTHILSRDIVHEAKAQINIMPAHIRQGSVLDDDIRAKIIADRRKDAERAAWKLEQRLKALVFAMGDHRALDTADVTMTRLEGAWQLHQESHSDLANKYDEVVYRIRALARNFAPDVATPTADDVLKIIQNLDQRGHQMLERMAAVTRALDFKNKQLQELADCLCVKTPVTESSIFDDIMVKWSTDQSKFNDLHEALKKEGEEKRMATEALKAICRLMGVAYPNSSSTLVADLKDACTRSQGKVTDLEKALLQEKEKNRQSGEDLQNLAKFFGLARPLETGSKILDIIKGKWVQSKALVSELKSCLMFEKEKNLLANETMQGLASFMSVEPNGCEATMVGNMMDRWTESKREVNDLRRALLEEKEKAREVQGALQAYLNRPVALMSSTSTQTDDHQHQSAHHGKVADKSAQTESSPRPAPNGQILLRQSATFELKTPVSNCGEDITKPMLEDTLSNGGHLPMLLQPPHQQKQQDRGSTSQIPLPTRGGTSVKLSHDIGDAGGVSGGNSNATSNAVRKTRKRSSPLDQSVDRELQKIKEHPTMSISFRGSSQCRSFSLSPNCDLTYVDPRCRSLEPITASTMFSPLSKVSLVHGFSAIANAAPENCHELPALPDIIVTNMSDLVPWEESRPRIELGSGIAGTVFLFRHRESQQPVALKIVENPGQCFRNEVRIHQEISGLQWFPTFYGSFEIAGNQAALAMEFLGSDDKSYTIADCLENTGPVLTRDEWFDIFTDAADGLKSLHAFGFLSNDLKEDNVMLVKQSGIWRAKIIDFGWASDISTPFVMNLDKEQIENYRNQGGCRHNAPECVLDGKPCSPSSDVYALGRLLAFVGQEMGYEDFLSYGRRIYYADQEQRPTVEAFIDELYDMQLVGGGEDGPGSSSC